MSNNSINESYSLTKWTPILSTDVYGFSDKKIELELTQFHLNKKQCYAKISEKNEIMPISYQQNQNNSELENENMQQLGSSQIIVKNPIKEKRKSTYKEYNIFPLVVKATSNHLQLEKTDSKSESDSDSDNFVTEHHSKRARNDMLVKLNQSGEMISPFHQSKIGNGEIGVTSELVELVNWWNGKTAEW
ncbi:hypothetical protein C2G38_2203147 [Gigaspora rosea]|uniref:Uncharacterized protein n=1 Tax=Gigaspora rosea TaxID=44941 RepID=A0A397UMT8_9GLOM|nr:hypothetical protein C2G38_2203147 [Gigaspora rosea]